MQPPGGVMKGQAFQVPFTYGDKSGPTSSVPRAEYQSSYQSSSGETAPFVPHGEDVPPSHDPHHIPRGQWRDGLFDFMRFGPFHPSFAMALCFPQCLNAQVLTRLRLNWLGESPDSQQEWKQTFRNVVILMAVYLVLSKVFSVPSPKFVEMEDGTLVNTTPAPSAFVMAVNNIINIGMASYTIITLMRARRIIRQRYHIPEDPRFFPGTGLEDLCCALWCGCCTVAQLARHTADYNYERGMFCTSNGLSVGEEDEEPLHPVVAV